MGLMWDRWKRWLWDWRGVVITTPTVAGLVIGLRLLGYLQAYELSAFDQFIRWRPLEPPDPRIVIVGINEADLRQAQQWPISDQQLAALIRAVRAQQPRVIGLNLYRDFPVKPGYDDLTRVYRTTPNLIGVEQIDPVNPADAVAPPPVLAELGQVSSNNVIIDSDGRLRRGLLSLEQDGQLVPSLGLMLALRYLQAEGIEPQPSADDPSVFSWGQARFHPLTPNEGGYVGLDIWGYQLLVNYRGPAHSFQTVSMTQVLQGQIPPDLIRNRIVLIGSTATSINDFFYSPYSSNRVSDARQLAGVEIHANVVSHLISAVLDGRPNFHTWPDLAEMLWIVAWAGVGSTLMWWWRYNQRGRIWSIRKLAGFILALVTLVGSSYIAFLGGLWLPVVPGLLALTTATVAIVVYMAYMASRIKNTFGRYLSDPVVAHLLEDPNSQAMGGESRQITLLNADIRGFTQISEYLSPQDVVSLLNIYLGAMTEVITRFGGCIDEFLGDGILALFGTPAPYPDAADRAIACALAMQQEMETVNQTLTQLGYPSLDIGIGLNTGLVVVGNIGSEKRSKYSVIGREVNRVFRIESCTIGGQVLAADATVQAIQSSLTIDHTLTLFLKGIIDATTLHSITAIRGQYTLTLPDSTAVWVTLPQPLAITCCCLQDKRLSNASLPGQLVELSTHSGKIQLLDANALTCLDPLSNLKLNLSHYEDGRFDALDLYGKVITIAPETGLILVHFTSPPPLLSELFASLYRAGLAS